MSTGSDILLQVRDMLQDSRGPTYRHSDEKLIRHLNRALSEALRIRPDLFYAAEYTFTPFDSGTIGGDLPIGGLHEAAIVEFVAGFTEAADDEFVLSGRAAFMMQAFRNALLGVETPITAQPGG